MRKPYFILLLLWSAISSAQSVSYQTIPSSGLKLITTKCILLDGKIVNAPSFEVLSYAESHGPAPACVAAYVNTALPLRHLFTPCALPLALKSPNQVFPNSAPVCAQTGQLNDAEIQALVKVHAQTSHNKSTKPKAMPDTKSYASGHSPVLLLALYEAVAPDRHSMSNNTDTEK